LRKTLGAAYMARDARKRSETGIYHVMLRGINHQTIFEDDEDSEKFLDCLAESKKLSEFDLYAYCLMGDHVHLLLKERTETLAQIFRRLGARYVYWYNWKYQRSGHLFQDRFKQA
jgi:REP element-mobilizing transposase RayT